MKRRKGDKFTFGSLLGSEFIYHSRYNKALAQRWTQHKGFDADSNSVLQKGFHATVKHSKTRTAKSAEKVFFFTVIGRCDRGTGRRATVQKKEEWDAYNILWIMTSASSKTLKFKEGAI